MLAQTNPALRDVDDTAWGDAIDADEAQPAEHSLHTEVLGEELFIAEAIL